MCPEENTVAEENNATDNADVYTPENRNCLLPTLFTTVLGKTAKVVGRQNSFDRVLISYSGKLIGNAFFNSKIGDVNKLLENIGLMIDEGFLEDENGNDVSSFVLPIDGIEMSENVDIRGIITDCDLSSYTNGFFGLFNQNGCYSSNIGNVLTAIGEFVNTLRHLMLKGYYLHKFDGHQAFFNAEYGTFQFMFDGVDLFNKGAASISEEQKELFERSVSAIIMRLLTGSWPLNCNNDILENLEINNDDCILFDSDTNDVCGTDDAMQVWNALPSIVKEALCDACLCDNVKNITLEEWIGILTEAKEEIEECAFCGSSMFGSANKCLYCHNTTKKDSLMTRWAIQNDTQPYYIRISFGRGTVLACEILGIQSNFQPLMNLMYNSKTNQLGVKNLSSIIWDIEIDGTTTQLLPGSIMPIKKDMVIKFEGFADLIMKFLGYDIK
ncbi:MAG: hypothetical protein IKK74_05645 [Clostridia bacterium]|nr:hypothetical protein [Clostridia bacterium]